MTDAEIQQLLDEAVAAAKLTTVGYLNKRWATPPPGSYWEQTLMKLAQARAALGSSAGPSGVPAPSADRTGWKLKFVDDFTVDCPLGSFPYYGGPASPVDPKWTSYPPSYPTTRTQNDPAVKAYYHSEKTVSIHDHAMHIAMHYDTGLSHYCCAAPIPKLYPTQTAKWQMSTFTYGRTEVCLRQLAPAGTYKIAWLLWGTNGAEIDYPELNLDESTNAYGFLHPGGGAAQTWIDSGTRLGPTFHRYAIEWTAGRLVFLRDDQVVKTITSGVPSGPMYWVLQSEVVLGNAPVNPADKVELEVDWVAFWEAT